MSEFELLVIPLSLVLGLGATSLLTGFIRAIRHRERISVHWVPLLWGASILTYTLLYFNVLFDLYELGRAWTWMIYGPSLAHTLLIFTAAALVFPSEGEGDSGSMLDDFERNGRLALIPMLILLGTAPFTNRIQFDNPFVGLNNLFNVLLSLVLIAALMSGRRFVQAATPVAFFVLSWGGFMVAWARPGMD